MLCEFVHVAEPHRNYGYRIDLVGVRAAQQSEHQLVITICLSAIGDKFLRAVSVSSGPCIEGSVRSDREVTLAATGAAARADIGHGPWF
jgi:hypothetical protein